MPQVFQVLRCYKCVAFQVHQVKKSNKWVCKLCGEKQSVKRHYGIGTGKECRLHVQKLNIMRGEKSDQISIKETSDDDFESDENNGSTDNTNKVNTKKESKWRNFVEKIDETNITTSVEEENETMFGKEVVLELPKKRRRTNYKKGNNIAQNASEEVNDEIKDTNVTISCDANVQRKKEFKKFVPPIIKTLSKWAEYNEADGTCQIDDIPCSDLSDPNIESNIIYLGANTVPNICPTLNTPITICQQRVFGNGKIPENTSHPSVNETNKKSKWTEFVDEIECVHEQPDCHYSQSVQSSSKLTAKPTDLFSLCDDNDLDSILDI